MICSIDGCDRPVRVKSRGWCNAHHLRWSRYGDPLGSAPPRPQIGCAVPGCTRVHHSGGWCITHYSNWRRIGRPEAFTREDRFWVKVDRRGPDECWPWKAYKTAGGYGRFAVGNGRMGPAHRFAYELLVGPVPDGLVLDHLCCVRACVNPSHLEPVTHAENVRRGESGRYNTIKTHCPQGHPYDEVNTYAIPSTGSRACRACQRERYAAKKVAA